MYDAAGATHLPDAVHAELRRAHVQRRHAQLRRHDWSDGAATRRVVTNHEVLVGKLTYLFKINKQTNEISSRFKNLQNVIA